MIDPTTRTPHALSVDHVAHFLPDISAAGMALIQLGFTLTPISAQSHRTEPRGPLLPAGTANRCIMLREGYLEFLTPTHDTPNAAQLRNAITNYTGVHLIAFGTESPDTDYARLTAEGFAPLPSVALQRQVDTANGEATARFTVVRVPSGHMAEGRIQYCLHHTPDVVWQERWLDHPNRTVGLAGVLLSVADPTEAAQRYARFTGLPFSRAANSCRIDTQRGYLLFTSATHLKKALGIRAPILPWIAGYILDSDDIDATHDVVGGECIDGRICVKLPQALGGVMLFQSRHSSPLQL